MLHISPFRQVLIVLTCMVGLALAVPNLFYDRVERHNDAVAAIDNGLSNEALEADAQLEPATGAEGMIVQQILHRAARSKADEFSI